MCKFFSFVGDGYGNFKHFNWEQRKTIKDAESFDSHTAILTYYGISEGKQDRWSRYEYNPLTKQFTIDEPVEGHDHEQAKRFANSLDFSLIVEPLIIKEVKNPLVGKVKKVTEVDIENLKKWASVGDFVRASVWDSVRASVWTSVWDSVRASVWASVRDSVWASVRAYISSFFNIQYKYDFDSLNQLWDRGFVPSFDDKTWRLHSGAKAKIVYEWEPGKGESCTN